MKADLSKLKKELDADSIDFKPMSVTQKGDNVKCQLLAYKDARVDMEILDESVGPENWQNKYKRDSKGVLQCGIGIKCEDEWVWKWSNGTPSDFEKEKGEYSDAFKRAGFMWGIGRKLYDFPHIWVILNKDEYYEKDGKIKTGYGFHPNSWKWKISEGYTKVVASQNFKGKWVERFNSNPYRENPPKPKTETNTGKSKAREMLEDRYDHLLGECKELIKGDELLNWSRSSTWGDDILIRKGKDLKELFDQRSKEHFEAKNLKEDTDDLPF